VGGIVGEKSRFRTTENFTAILFQDPMSVFTVYYDFIVTVTGSSGSIQLTTKQHMLRHVKVTRERPSI